MKKIIVALSIILGGNAFADEWHQGVQGICDADNNVFKINYIFGYNEEGLSLVESKNSQSKNECELGGETYTFSTNFKMGHPEGLGRCGSHIYVSIDILNKDESIYKDYFLTDCHHATDYISNIEVNESGEITVNRIDGFPF